ncbi:phosphoserine phosphatase SerB [Glacieibacterium frigidum]|nr:phosphoserine phosphatase SerB [Glacieibacterium frigidum]
MLVTLIAARLSPGDVTAASDALRGLGAVPAAVTWLDPSEAVDIPVRGGAQPALRAAVEAAVPHADVVVQPMGAERRKRLLIADMDSTMIGCECIDELADYAGLKLEVAAVTEAAMRGDLDFAGALRARVALLKGLDESVIARCLAERVRETPGGSTLLATMRKAGARAILVSGGFSAFAEPVGRALSFDRIVANRLGITNGRLDGTVGEPIVDAATKRTELLGAGVPLEETLAVGDGANDIPMLEAAGLGIAFHAKPRAAAAADAHIRHGDLSALLWAQGYARRDWEMRT